MAVRYLKMLLVVFVGLQGWFYVAGNLANWEAGYGAVAYVLGMQHNEVYSQVIFPPITHPALVTVAFLTIITGEFLVGALCMKGAFDLWRQRNAHAAAFNQAKTFALLGPGMAMVVWFGGFVVVGGALFQMWQSEVGIASFEGAFIYSTTSALVLLFVNSPDP